MRKNDLKRIEIYVHRWNKKKSKIHSQRKLKKIIIIVCNTHICHRFIKGKWHRTNQRKRKPFWSVGRSVYFVWSFTLLFSVLLLLLICWGHANTASVSALERQNTGAWTRAHHLSVLCSTRWVSNCENIQIYRIVSIKLKLLNNKKFQ